MEKMLFVPCALDFSQLLWLVPQLAVGTVGLIPLKCTAGSVPQNTSCLRASPVEERSEGVVALHLVAVFLHNEQTYQDANWTSFARVLEASFLCSLYQFADEPF